MRYAVYIVIEVSNFEKATGITMKDKTMTVIDWSQLCYTFQVRIVKF